MGNCCSQLLALTGLLVVFRLRIGIKDLFRCHGEAFLSRKEVINTMDSLIDRVLIHGVRDIEIVWNDHVG